MSFRTSSHLTVLFCLIVISSVVFGQEEQARKWVDKTGKHELQAKFLDLDGDTVLLEMEGGKRMKIKLDQLSFDDQKYAITARTKMVASGDSSPFKSVGDSPMPTTPEKTSSGDEAKVINVRWTNARVMNPLLAPEEWSLEPDPAPATEAIESNAIPLPVKRDFFEGLSGTTADAGAGLVCVAHTLDHGGQKNTRVEVVDLKAGKVVRQAILDNLWAPLAVSDEGNTVVMRSNTFGFGGKERLAIWQMNADRTATPLRGWICGQPQARGGSAKDINWGAMVEGNRLVTLTGDGRLTIWDSEAGEPKAYMDMGSNAHATVSPGGKYILCGVGSALVVIEPARLRLVASLNIPEAEDQSAKVSVSPDGTRFAFGFGSNTHVYDFASARRLHEVVGISTFGDLAWADENHLLVGTGSSRSLINLEAGFLVWTYSGMSDVFRFGDFCWFLTSSQKNASLLGLKLPRRDAREAVERAFNDPDFFAVAQGKSVRIDVSGITDSGERQKAQESLEKKMRDNGVEISNSASVTIFASVKRGEPREVEFKSFFSPHFSKGDVRTVSGWNSNLQVKEGEKVLWEGASNVFPHHVSLKDGESLDQALARMDKPNYGFFSSVVLPRNIPRDGGRNGLGTTDIGRDGF